MSKPRAKWWSYIRHILYDYPRMRSELDALQAPLQSTGEHYGGHGTGRPAEAAALRTLPDRQEQKELEAVEAAIRETEQKPDGERTARLVWLVFFRRYTVPAAAGALGWSVDHAYKRQAAFIHLVAHKMGYE